MLLRFDGEDSGGDRDGGGKGTAGEDVSRVREDDVAGMTRRLRVKTPDVIWHAVNGNIRAD